MSPKKGDQGEYDEWLKLKCANGVVGWIFIKDIKNTPGLTEADISEYGKASDQTGAPRSAGISTPSVLAPIKALVPFEFRGHKIGERVDKSFPYWAKGYRSFDQPYCSKHDNGTVSCADSVRMIGDVYVGSLLYFLFDQKLYSIGMSFHTNAHSKIRTMLIGRYGPPNTERNEPVQNAMGAIFDNLISQWNFVEGSLVLKMRSGKVDSSFLTFHNPTIELEAGRRAVQKQQEQGKRAF